MLCLHFAIEGASCGLCGEPGTARQMGGGKLGGVTHIEATFEGREVGTSGHDSKGR